MKILVTGGAGFIGSHLVDFLLQRGDKVTVFDDLTYGKRKNVSASAKFIKGSVTNNAAVQKLFGQNKFDAIVHLAAQKNARHSVADPIFDAQQNILGSIYLLEEARKHQVKRFVFTSTGGVMYGEAKKIPTPETAEPDPLSPYAIAKRSVEYYLHYYSAVHNISTMALRLSNVYGPRQDPKGEAGVVAIFITKLLDGKRPEIFGKGQQTRDYIYVSDAVSAIAAGIDKNVQGHYNIGAGKQVSVNEIAEKIAKVTAIAIKPKHGQAIAGEQMKSALDSMAARKKLGWKPRVSLDEGLKLTSEWFIHNRAS